jgi:CO/xanthine dehydrogenase Mo-binding subunit
MGVVGVSVPVRHAQEKVTGALPYMVNMELPGMLRVKVLRSPYAHARLLRVDASKAAALPGVAAVLTRDDLLSWEGCDPYYGPMVRDQAIVAIDRVRFEGEPVAAVAAESEQIAEAALDLIEVEYEPLPHVLDVLEAYREDAPRVHDRINLHPTGPEDIKSVHWGTGPNVCSYSRVRRGDVERGFAEADLILEGEYRTPVQQHCHLEPHASMARVRDDGSLEVWSSAQSPSVVRDGLAGIFNLPLSKVRVVVPYLGAGYGSKTYLKTEPLVCALARKTRGRPVKWVLTREEVFHTVTRHATVVRMKTGFRKDGTITAREATAFFDAGAAADVGPRTSKNGGYSMAGPYRVPNVKFDTYNVYTNKVPSGAFRGFGVAQVAWAYEQEMDRAAEALGLDPLEIRRRNIAHDGDLFATGQPFEAVAFEECLEAVAREIGWGTPKPEPSGSKRYGRGLAVIAKTSITPSYAGGTVKMDEDGSIEVLASSVEMGQGAETVLSQIAAEVLALPMERVKYVHPDTDVTPYDQGTQSSRTTFSAGSAVAWAAHEVRRQLLDMGAEQLEARVEDLTLEDGHVVVRGAPERRLSYEQLMRNRYNMRVGTLVGHGAFKSQGGLDRETGQGIATAFFMQGAVAAEVEVDVETGHVRVLRLVGAANAGRAIHPLLVETQLEGALGQALALTMYEEMVFEGGQLANPNFLDYRLPTLVEAPELRAIIVEKPHPRHPMGAIGCGESVIPPTAPALANAIADACGARVTTQPITPEKVLAAIRASRARQAQAEPAPGTAGARQVAGEAGAR